MKTEVKLPDNIVNRVEYKRKFSILEMYQAFVTIPSAAIQMIRNCKSQLIE